METCRAGTPLVLGGEARGETEYRQLMKVGALCLTQPGFLPESSLQDMPTVVEDDWEGIILADALGGAVLPRFLVRSTEDL